MFKLASAHAVAPLFTEQNIVFIISWHLRMFLLLYLGNSHFYTFIWTNRFQALLIMIQRNNSFQKKIYPLKKKDIHINCID